MQLFNDKFFIWGDKIYSIVQPKLSYIHTKKFNNLVGYNIILD